MPNFLDDLNSIQREAAGTVNGPVMIVAGAGSGKTRLLTYRIANLISIGVPSYQILALTFTNKAANEMKERITALVGDKSRSIWMGTFHSMFARLLRNECTKIGFERNFSIYDSADSLSAIKTIMGNLGIPTTQFNPNAVRSRISGAKNALVYPEEYLKKATDISEERTGAIYNQYQKTLKSSNAMDFDDLLLKPIELFERHKKVLDEQQERFRFILVDEYQDTNRAQYTLINMLAAKYQNICVVGDDAQSIYAFRGADIKNILDFERDFPDAKVFRLEQNYRSTKTILGAADRVIKNNVNQIKKTLWTENADGELISVIECEDDREEGAQIVNRIFQDSPRFKTDFKDFAILYRTNAQSRSLEDALRRNAIPYTIVGGVEFYQRKEIKDVLAYLRLLANPKDNESFLRIVNFPPRGLGDVTLGKLQAFANELGISLLEACGRSTEITGLTDRPRQALGQVAVMFSKYIQLKSTLSPSELSRAVVDEIGVLSMLKEENTREAQGRWENVQELLSAISELNAEDPQATLESFLEEVALVADVAQTKDVTNSVTLMTLHSAKGLEFPVVFITGLEEGLFPLYNSSLDKLDLEEERRLYYVGMTRAMLKLYLTFARTRFRYGEMSSQSPSRFIEETGSENLEIVSQRRQYQPATGAKALQTPAGWGSRPGSRPVPKKERSSTFYADQTPDYENESHIVPALSSGAKVEHEIFGPGRVLSVTGSGETAKAVVDFPRIGRKNLLLKYANLKLL